MGRGKVGGVGDGYVWKVTENAESWYVRKCDFTVCLLVVVM